MEQLAAEGKKFNWQKPTHCLNCKNKLWGHGYQKAYFDGYDVIFYLKRYRCPKCGIVITMRPSGYWKKYQSSIYTIYKVLKFRLSELKWPPWTQRNRACHWLKNFKRKIKMDFGFDNQGMTELARLDHLFYKGIFFLG